jgi:hydrogenase maturation protease
MANDSAILIMGVGNELRNDDRVGLVLARSLPPEQLTGVRVVTVGGDITAWYRHWAGARTVILMDAVVTGAAAGTLHLYTLTGGVSQLPRSASTHGLGLGHIVELARKLNRLPSKLIIVGIEGADFGFGTTLSPPVQAALPDARAVILEALAAARRDACVPEGFLPARAA